LGAENNEYQSHILIERFTDIYYSLIVNEILKIYFVAKSLGVSSISIVYSLTLRCCINHRRKGYDKVIMNVKSRSIFGKAGVTYFKKGLECRVCIETGENREIPQSG
jgi:hypothetical protein